MAGYDNNKLGELRPNQIITTFGPGSIVDAVKDSVTILDIPYWKDKGMRIIDGRLASYLNVDAFYMPRTSFAHDIPVQSFPRWHVCSNLKCGRLFDASESFDLEKYLKFGVTCPDCGRKAYPARFITICENGHMSDFPWRWWVHHGDTSCNGRLRMYSTGNTSTLSDMWVECSCGAKRSMSGATQAQNFEGLSCRGTHPFRPNSRPEHCEKPVIPSQRGASNVYFAVTRSAISIPPWVNPLYNLVDEHLRDIELLKDVLGEQEGLEKDIFMLGYQEHITTLLSQLDIVVMASRWEGFPLIPIEAFSVKKTLVASDIEGIRDIVTNGKSGLLVPKDSPELFSESVFTLLSDNKMKSRMEEEGWKYYHTMFDYEKFYDFIKTNEAMDNRYKKLCDDLYENNETYGNYLFNVPHIYNQMVAHLIKDKTGKSWYDDESF